MERKDERREDDLIDLGTVSVETKGVASDRPIDTLGQFSGGGLSDD